MKRSLTLRLLGVAMIIISLSSCARHTEIMSSYEKTSHPRPGTKLVPTDTFELITLNVPEEVLHTSSYRTFSATADSIPIVTNTVQKYRTLDCISITGEKSYFSYYDKTLYTSLSKVYVPQGCVLVLCGVKLRTIIAGEEKVYLQLVSYSVRLRA